MTTKNFFPRYCWVASLLLLTHPIVQASSFSTTLRQCSKSSLGLVIPNENSNGVRHTINVSDHGHLKDVNVILSEILHDFVGELSIFIIHDGTFVTLMDRPGIPGSEFGCWATGLGSLKIDDESLKSVETDCTSETTGYESAQTYSPNSPLSVFDGMEVNGEWTLIVQDNASFSDKPGTLNKWCLEYTDESVADLSTSLPSQFDFGSSNVGSPVHITFSITETSTIDPLIVSANLKGSHISDFKLYADSFSPPSTLQPIPYTATISPSSTHFYRVECRPGGAGAREADLELQTNSASQPLSIYHLTCTGITAGYDSLPRPESSLNFGSIETGVSTTEQMIEIKEISEMASLSINATITGMHKEDFSVSSYSSSVVPGGQGYLNVMCRPLSAGPHTATLEVDTNDPSFHPARYTLTCEGLSAKFKSSPSPSSRLEFGTTQPGVPVNKIIKIINEGNKPLTLDKLDNEASAILGDSVFNLDISLPYLLPEGSSVTVSVSCVPITTESSTADLTLRTDDPTNPTVRYPLSCIGSSTIEPLYTSLAPYPPGSKISFDYVPTTAKKSLVVREIGSAPLTITEALIEGPDASDFSVTGVSFPMTIPNGGEDVPLTVECTPNPINAGKMREAKLTLMTDATNEPQPSYFLSCQGPKSGYASTPTIGGTVTFPNVMVNQTASKTITIKEIGDSPLVVDLAETPLTGTNPLDFKILTVFPLTINNGEASKTLAIECQPSMTGNLSATLNLVSNDLDNPTPTYLLKCTGKGIVGPGYGSTPLPNSAIKFGKTPIGKPIKATFSIQEVGSVILAVGKDISGNIVPPTIEGEHAADFSLLTPTFPFNIPNGKPAQQIFLQCTPSSHGLRTATLTITSNHLAQTSTHAYFLQCEGLPPGYGSTPSPQTVLDVGKAVIHEVSEMNFKIQETGDSTLRVMNPIIEGPHAQEFKMISPEFPLEIPDATPEQIVTVQCSPWGEGKRMATLTLESNDPFNPQPSYPLECTGIPPAGYSSNPPLESTISVGNILLGSSTKTTFEIQETGGIPLRVDLDEPALTGEFASDFAVSSFPITIEDGGAAQGVTVVCTPSSVGIRAATLHLVSNDPANPRPTYVLECGGIPIAGYYSSPPPGSSLNFGKVPIGDSATSSFDVQELGNTLLQVDLAVPPFTGEAASDFSIVSPKFPFSILDGGANKTVTVKCQPSAKGKRLATLNLSSNSPLNPTHRYRLECYGTSTTSKEEGEDNIVLTVSLKGQGHVTSTPKGIDCSPEDESCYSNHVSNDKVLLSAKADEGFVFDQWTGDCDAQGQVILKTSQHCTALFKPLVPYPLTVTLVGEGKVISMPKGIECENNAGQCTSDFANHMMISLQAIPAENWEFKGWEGACDQEGKVNMGPEKRCQASFIEIPPAEQVTLTVEKTGSGEGSITNQSLHEIDCGTDCRYAYRLHSVQTLTAIPQTGSVFVEWNGDCQGTKNSTEVTLTGSKTCVAHFEKHQTPPYAHHTLTLNVTGMGNGSVAKEVACTAQCHQPVYPDGTSITLTAQAEKDSQFTGWSGHCSGTENPLTLIMNSDKNCMANFDQRPEVPSYTLTVLMGGEGSALVTSSPEGINLSPACHCSQMSASYPAGTILMLAASPQKGTKFLGWSGDQECHEGQQILMNQNITCIATFAEDIPPPIVLPEADGPSCPVEGTINVVCNYENKWQLKNVTIGEQGNISNATLEGTLYNKGWISNVKLQAQSTLSGGVLTGYIENGGMIKDVIFRGAVLTGGILAGTILSDDKLGIIQNVQFAPNTYVSGGKLYGNIEGDQDQPALLENVIIIEGSTLDNVMIGKGVKLEGKVNLGPGVVFMDSRNLLLSKLISKEVDARGQTLKDLTVSEEGKLSHGILEGTILNQGILEDVTFGKNSQLTGGLLIGQIINQGTLTHIEFQGDQLIGGILRGTIRNTGDGVIQDVELTSETHVMGGRLAGEIIGHGARLEGVVIQGQVRDVVLGQDIQNQGVIQDAEFKGELLSGGKLSGNIENTQGGTIQNVHLKGETHLQGGNLQGDIIGEADYPALLENVRIVAGSYLEHVILGEGVVLPKKVTLGPGVQFVHPPEDMPKQEEKPQKAPSAIGINAQGQVVIYQTTFTYELKTSEGVQQDGALLSVQSAQQVTLSATMTLEPKHVGQQADIVVASVYKESPSASPETYMHVGKQWVAWDYDIKQLEPYRVQKLSEKLDIPIFTEEDLSSTPGEYTLLVGYRLKDGTIVYNGKTPIHFFVNGAPKRCVLYAVHDEKVNDTQLIKIDLSRSLWGIMQPFGPLHSGRDIEGLTLHPNNPDVLYATSGDDSKVEGQTLDGYLYSINRKTAELTLIGPTGFDQVAAMGTDPVEKVLWAWGERKQGKERQWSGLIQIDPLTGKGTPIKQFDPKDSMGGLAVSADGSKIYTSSGGTLWIYDKETQEMQKACDHITKGRIEGLDMQPNGILLLGIDLDQTTTITAYDPEACEVIKTRTYEGVKYNDIESIVWPAMECNDQSWLGRESD